MQPTTEQPRSVHRAAREATRIAKQNRLKAILLGGDLLAVALAYLIAATASGFTEDFGWGWTAGLIGLAVAVAAWAIRAQGLLRARVSVVRTVELTRLARVTALVALGVVLADRMAHVGIKLRVVAFAALLTMILLAVWRSVYRAWISSARARGRFARRMLIVGTDPEARRLIDLFTTHREMGIEVVGVVGDRDEAVSNRLGAMWLGSMDQTTELVDQTGCTGVLITTASAPKAERCQLIRDLSRSAVHIHLAMGVSGVSSRRIRALPLAHEPMLYIEGVSLARSQFALKRVFDVLAASLMLLLASPVMVVAAIAVKLQDRGPVFFRQQRIGRFGRTFEVYKFRSMSVDAEARLGELLDANERSGPLFKLTHDPRVTRVGRFLRDTSIDELPQLFNVLRGEMSLVGPRPALPSEVDKFSAELRERERVLPGITGLWQVEARDNSSFEAYSRLDLFYVENWSLTLDLMIMLATAEHLAVRVLRTLRPRKAAELPTSTPNPPVEPMLSDRPGDLSMR
jgi:exopolysaccharide biosynthesis polyprenyl glycosylphosphotransferase